MVASEYNGGATEPSNMRPICAGCNQSMGLKNWNEWDLKNQKLIVSIKIINLNPIWMKRSIPQGIATLKV